MKQDPASDLRELLDSLLGKGLTIRPLRPGQPIELSLPQSPDSPSSIRIEAESVIPDRTSLSPSRRVMAIVSRDHPAVFTALKGRLEPEYGQVVWDRRTVTRRVAETPVSTERRAADRRGIPPTSWDIWGFLMIPQEAPDG